MPPLRLLLLSLSLGFTIAAHAADPLQLSAEIDGRYWPVAGVEKRQPYCLVDGKRRLVPRDARWQLTGDLRAHARYVQWSGVSYTWSPDVPDRERLSRTHPYKGYVYLEYDEPTALDPGSNQFLLSYPKGTTAPGIAVLAWTHNGRVEQVTARMIPPSRQAKYFYASHEFELTADEAEGLGVVLVWSEGAFLPVAPRFSQPEAQRAYEALATGDSNYLSTRLGSAIKANVADRTSASLLHYAAEFGQTEAIDQLLAAGARPNDLDRVSITPLDRAVRFCRPTAVDRLLAGGANPNMRSTWLATLHTAIDKGSKEMALRLLDRHEGINVVTNLNRLPLSAAIASGLVDVARALEAHGARMDFSHEQMERVLITQAHQGHTAMVQYLLEKKVKPDTEYRDQTALIAGAASGDPEIARSLIAAGAAPSQAASSGMTPLMAAALAGQVEYGQVLLDAGAPIDAIRSDGTSALHLAAAARADTFVTCLLERGADPRAGSAPSPLHLALLAGSGEVATSIAERGGQLDLSHPLASELIEAAIMLDVAPVIRTAIANGWSPNTRFRETWSALQIADACGAENVAAILRPLATRADPPIEIARVADLDDTLRPIVVVAPRDPRDINTFHGAEIVEVDIVIDPEGAVRFPRIAGTPNIFLSGATLEAITAWRFSPPRRGNRPVATTARLPIEFPSYKYRVFDSGDVDVPATLIRKEYLDYPAELDRARYGGSVLLRCVINTAGRAQDIRVASSSHPALDAAAIESLKKWVFKPALLDGKPVPTWRQEHFVFR